MSLRSLLFGSVGSALVLAGESALAAPGDPAPVTLTWSAPEGCPSGEEVKRRIVERLPPDASVGARGRVERVRDRYRLVLEIGPRAERSERILEAESCDALVASAAIVIAMSVAPAEAEPAPAPPIAPSSEKPIDRDRDREAPKPRETTRDKRLGVRLEAAGDIGMLPSPAAGLGVAVGIDPVARLHIEAFGGTFLSQEATVAESPSRGAALDLWSAGARGCYALTRGIEVAPCVGAEILHMSATGYGSLRVTDASSTTWAPEALVTLRVPVAGPLSLRAGVGGFVPMSRQTFVITAIGAVHRPEPVVARAFLGPELHF